MQLGPFKILLVEDSPNDYILVRETIADSQLDAQLHRQDSLAGSLAELESNSYDCVLLDLSLRDAQGQDVLRQIVKAAKKAAVVVLTGGNRDELAMQAIRDGAQDFLQKSVFEPEAFARAIFYAIQRKRMSLRLQASEDRFSLVTKATRDGIWDWEVDSDSLFTTSQWHTMIGAKRSPYLLKLDHWLSLVHIDDRHRLERALLGTKESTPVELEYRIRHKDGSDRYMRNRWIAVLEDGNLKRIVGAQTDISEHRFYDRQTGLPSRALLEKRTEGSLKLQHSNSSQQCVVLVIILDNFTSISDAYGSALAEELLLVSAQRIAKVMRDTDTVSHLQSAEFAVLLQGASTTVSPIRTAERIREVLNRPFQVRGPNLRLTASVGIAFPALSSNPHSAALVHDAETAAHEASALGGDQVQIFDNDTRQKIRNNFTLASRLRKAVVAREFRVWYQPIIAPATEQVASLEALVRWQSPENELLGPEDFLHCAEETGTIVPMGYQVLETVCASIASRSLCKISINVSSAQLRDGNFLSHLDDTMATYGVTSSQLGIEVSERTLSEIPAVAQLQLRALHKRGISLALDDFGLSLASLSYLHLYPFDVVKIDASLTRNLETKKASILASNMIRIAHELDLKTIAEAVETDAQLALLKRFECDHIQGFVYAKPMSLQALQSFPKRTTES